MPPGFLIYFQLFGVTLAVLTIWLDTRENVLARPLTLLGTTMSFYVYYTGELYAKCLHNIANFLLNIYGWHQWLYGGKHQQPLKIGKTSARTLWRMLLITIVGTLVVGKLLQRYTNAAFVYLDSSHTVICLIAQWMLARKKLESWLVWLVADILYVPICYYRGLYLFSGLHALYTLLAIRGYRTWRQSYIHDIQLLQGLPNS